MKRTRSNTLKKTLGDILVKYPESRLVKNRYKTMRLTLQPLYPLLTGSVPKETLENFLREAIYIDRQIRYETEGEEKELKIILAQEKVLQLDRP